MPKKLKLSWIGSLKQWKKVYKGKQHWLGTGTSKDDLSSYKAALERWEAKKVEIDKAARKEADKSGYETWRNLLAAREGIEPHVYLTGGEPPPESPPTTPEEDAEMMARIPVLATTYPFAPQPPSTDKDSKTMEACITAYLEKQKQRYPTRVEISRCSPIEKDRWPTPHRVSEWGQTAI